MSSKVVHRLLGPFLTSYILLRVCFNKTFFFFICVCFRQTLLYVSVPIKHHLTQLTFQRNGISFHASGGWKSGSWGSWEWDSGPFCVWRKSASK